VTHGKFGDGIDVDKSLGFTTAEHQKIPSTPLDQFNGASDLQFKNCIVAAGDVKVLLTPEVIVLSLLCSLSNILAIMLNRINADRGSVRNSKL